MKAVKKITLALPASHDISHFPEAGIRARSPRAGPIRCLRKRFTHYALPLLRNDTYIFLRIGSAPKRAIRTEDASGGKSESGFAPGRASLWAGEAAISADGLLLDAAHKAQRKLIQSLSGLGEAIQAGNAQEWLVTAHKEAIEAAQLIGHLRIETPGDAANAQRMTEGAR